MSERGTRVSSDNAPEEQVGRDSGLVAAEEVASGPYVHPDGAALFAACPWVRNVPVFGKSCEGFGPKCTVALGLTNFLTKGVADNLLTLSRQGMYLSRFKIDAQRYQRLASISGLGFSIKAVVAMLSDTFAFMGFTKRWYCALSCVIGGVFILCYGLLPAKPSSANTAAALSFLGRFCIANVDILTEGHYSRLMRRHPESGVSLVSFIYWFILGASLIASAIQGPLSDSGAPQIGAFVATGCQIAAVVFFIFNWFGERRNRINRVEDIENERNDLLALEALERDAAPEPTKDLHPEMRSEPLALEEELPNAGQDAVLALDAADQSSNSNDDEAVLAMEEAMAITSCCCGAFEINKEVVLRNWRIFVFSVVMTAAVVSMTVVTIVGDTWDLLYCAIPVAVVCCGMAFWALPLLIAKVFVYFYLHLVIYIQIPGAMDTFYLADSTCVPDGPHFNYTFYQTIAGIIGNAAGIVTVTLFPYLFAKRGYRFTLIFTMIIEILASLFDLIIVKRWNIYIGIPDHAMYILGDAIVYQVCYYFAWMPTVLLISRVCPRGSESLVYALVASAGNLGNSMAGTIGSLLIELAWPVDTTSRPCDFSNVQWLLVVGHMLTPLLVIPLSFLLIPNARVCDDIDVEGHVRDPKALNGKNRDIRDSPSIASETEPIAA